MKSLILIRVLKTFLVLLIFSSSYNIAQDYYPLEIGNRWDYRTVSWQIGGDPPDTSYFSVEVIGDTILENNQRYFHLDREDLIGGEYIRTDGEFIYYYNTYQNAEDTLINLLAQLNDPVYPESEYAWSVELLEIDTLFFLGNETRILRYKLDGLILRYVNLSDMFGLYHLDSPGEPPWPGSTQWSINLYHAMIGGEEYGTPLSVDEINSIDLDDYSLSQNYPNPFNPETKIEFAIPEMDYVTLKVYDVLGNEVETLVNEEKAEGSYEIKFDASGLSSGIYFYQLKSKYSTLNKKMIYLK